MAPKLSRRDFVKVTSVTAASAAAGVGLVGCGDDASTAPVAADAVIEDSAAGLDAVDVGVPLEEVGPEVSVDAGPELPEPDLPRDEGPPRDDGPPGDASLEVEDASPTDVAVEDVPPDDVQTGPTFVPADVPEDEQAFPLGVQAGDATTEGVVLWTRYLGAAPLRVVVFAEAPTGPGAILAELDAEPGPDGFTHLTVSDLTAGTWYRYAYVVRDEAGQVAARSAIGHVRTAPAAGSLETIVFGGTSCTNQTYKPFNALKRAAEAKLDFFLLAGDTTYADGSSSVADYRGAWEENLATSGYQKLMRSTGLFATWDDHEVDNNWSPESHPADQIANARQVMFEHLAVRRDAEAPDRIWRSHRWGDTLEVFVLDCRGERKPSTRETADAVYVSPEQLAWFQQALTASPCVFKVILNSVPITNMPLFYISTDDRWEGYAAQRQAILAITNQVPGVLWVAGDFHFGAVTAVEPAGPNAEQMEVFMGPGGQFTNPAYLLIGSGSAQQFRYLTGANNYTRFTAEPEASPPRISVAFIEADGAVAATEVLEFPGA